MVGVRSVIRMEGICRQNSSHKKRYYCNAVLYSLVLYTVHVGVILEMLYLLSRCPPNFRFSAGIRKRRRDIDTWEDFAAFYVTRSNKQRQDHEHGLSFGCGTHSSWENGNSHICHTWNFSVFLRGWGVSRNWYKNLNTPESWFITSAALNCSCICSCFGQDVFMYYVHLKLHSLGRPPVSLLHRAVCYDSRHLLSRNSIQHLNTTFFILSTRYRSVCVTISSVQYALGWHASFPTSAFVVIRTAPI